MNSSQYILEINIGLVAGLRGGDKVNIPPLKSFITIEGGGAEKTVVQWGDTTQTIGPNGKPLGTFGPATFAVNSPYLNPRTSLLRYRI
ncbi:hypothetical protein LguiA_009542 [Lonicera macranthoides]